MRDNKRIYSADDSGKKPPRIRSQSPSQEAAEAAAHSRVERNGNGNAFPRELVLRLIDWVKHI